MPAWYWAFATLAAAGLAVGAATQGDWFFFTALAVVFVSSAFFWWTRPRVLRANLPVAEDLD
jgi:hypothetical protein